MHALHLIGNAHLDPVWLWRMPEGCQETRATFRSALDRMNEFEDFVFTCAGAGAYKWVEDLDPGLFEEIRKRVAEGRWVIVGGWWVQPDCNIPGGEAFARHALYSQRYFASRFGVMATVGYTVDSFGHNAMLPQILKKSGMDAYVMMRPDAEENPAVPDGSFTWESADGSRILVHRIIGQYGGWGKIEEKVARISKHLSDEQPALMLFYGVGNHGGGPTIANLEEIEALRAGNPEPALRYSSPNAFFEALGPHREKLPVWKGDLLHHASGCYATRDDIKRANRQSENRLLVAERWDTVTAWALGTPVSTTELARAWENVLFNQFHDIMGGCSIPEASDDAMEAYGESLSIAARTQNAALQRLAAVIDTRGEGTPLILFNPHAFTARIPVEVELAGFLGNHARGYLRLVDDRGQYVPCQLGRTSVVQRDRLPGQGTWRHRISFIADLPALGYRTYRVESHAEAVVPTDASVTVETLPLERRFNYHWVMDGRRTLALENEHLRLEIDGRVGCLSRFYDKDEEVELLAGRGALALVMDDRTDTWSHGTFDFRDQVGHFSDARVSVLEQGPVRTIIRAISTFGRSRLIQDFVLYAGMRQVELRIKVDWQERLRILKLAFPLAITNATATYEIPFGTSERAADGRENPVHSWLDVAGTGPAGKRFGMSIANDGKYSVDVRDGEVRLTVLRSCVQAHHADNELEAGREYAVMNLGEQECRFLLLPHAGDWRNVGTVGVARLLNAPPVALVEHLHKGALPATNSFASVDVDHVELTVLKAAEEAGADAPGWILRAVETTGRAVNATLTLPLIKRTLVLDFGPYEIKTVFIPGTNDEAVRETNLLEA